MTPRRTVKPVRRWCILSPLSGPHLETYGLSSSPHLVRSAAIKIGTICGGHAEGENWAALYKKGYRIVPVTVTPDKPRTRK